MDVTQLPVTGEAFPSRSRKAGLCGNRTHTVISNSGCDQCKRLICNILKESDSDMMRMLHATRYSVLINTVCRYHERERAAEHMHGETWERKSNFHTVVFHDWYYICLLIIQTYIEITLATTKIYTMKTKRTKKKLNVDPNLYTESKNIGKHFHTCGDCLKWKSNLCKANMIMVFMHMENDKNSIMDNSSLFDQVECNLNTLESKYHQGDVLASFTDPHGPTSVIPFETTTQKLDHGQRGTNEFSIGQTYQIEHAESSNRIVLLIAHSASNLWYTLLTQVLYLKNCMTYVPLQLTKRNDQSFVRRGTSKPKTDDTRHRELFPCFGFVEKEKGAKERLTRRPSRTETKYNKQFKLIRRRRNDGIFICHACCQFLTILSPFGDLRSHRTSRIIVHLCSSLGSVCDVDNSSGRQLPLVITTRADNLENNLNNNRDDDVEEGKDEDDPLSPTGDDEESIDEEDADKADEDDESGDSDDDSKEELNLNMQTMTGVEWMDSFLVVWHAGFLIMSVFFLFIGSVLRFFFPSLVEGTVKSSEYYILYSQFVKMEYIPSVWQFGNLTNVLGEALLVSSILYIGCVLMYMTYLLHKIPFTLPLVIIVSNAVVLVEINIINIYMSPASEANENARATLKGMANEEYAVGSHNPFAVTYDIISIWGQCCGIVDQYDFQNVVLKHSLPHRKEFKTLQVPPTCCRPETFKRGVEAVVECAVKAEGIYTDGCYSVMYKWLRTHCNLYSVVIVMQLIDILIHIFLYKKHLRLLDVAL